MALRPRHWCCLWTMHWRASNFFGWNWGSPRHPPASLPICTHLSNCSSKTRSTTSPPQGNPTGSEIGCWSRWTQCVLANVQGASHGVKHALSGRDTSPGVVSPRTEHTRTQALSGTTEELHFRYKFPEYAIEGRFPLPQHFYSLFCFSPSLYTLDQRTK